jgi:hypothetical protein
MKSNRWPGEFHRPPKAEVDLFTDFDETVADIGKDLDETVRNLRVLRDRSHTDEEERRYQFKAIADLTETVKEHGAVLQRVIASLKLKQPKAAAGSFEQAMAAKIDKRLDSIFKLVAALGVIFAALIAVIGWGLHK